MNDQDIESEIDDQGGDRKYFTIIPNSIDDNKLINPYEFRLYVHLKRVAGDNGKSWQSTKTLAKACHMSVGAVVKARVGLHDLGLIHMHLVENTHGGRDYLEITIQDVWPGNFPASSPHELASSLSEPIKIPIKNIPDINAADAALLSVGQQIFLTSFGAKRYKTNAQSEAVLALENKYGIDILKEGVRWAAEAGMDMGRAIHSLQTALPKWGRSNDKTASASRPPMSEVEVLQEDLRNNPGKPAGEYAERRLKELGVKI